MNETTILYMGEPAKVACDRNCGKAWGIQNRPKLQLSDDPDDVVWLADGELGDAPQYPGTWEGGDGKPLSPDEFPNKWCTRECERSGMSERGEYDRPVILPDHSKRLYNQPWKHRLQKP